MLVPRVAMLTRAALACYRAHKKYEKITYRLTPRRCNLVLPWQPEAEQSRLSTVRPQPPGAITRCIRRYERMSIVESFPPIVSERSKLLILGSMPGPASLEAGEYYGYSHNAFWRIMGEFFGALPTLPYDKRVEILLSVGVALWDTLKACSRVGGLDTAIRDEVANDFLTLFTEYPNITHVFFNGTKAQKVFLRKVLPTLTEDRRKYALLPSTSPAYRSMRLEAKIQAWSVIKDAL